jgi:nucleotide-binding universal stress UspA family protein
MYKKIVVGTDLSKTSRIAVAHAAALASRLGSGLVLVHAGDDPGEPLAELGSKYGAEVVARPGSPAEVLLSEAESHGAELLVTGSVGMSGAKRFKLGNVPNKLSHHADRDMLIVKTDVPGKTEDFEGYAKILVGTDGSPTAQRAVKMAATLAKELGAKLSIVTAYEPPTEHELEQARKASSGDMASMWSASKTQRDTPPEFQWRIAGASQAEDVLERAEDCAVEVGYEGADVRTVEGPPAETLLSIAEDEDFDLIAVGSVGMAGAKRFMLGNVPHRLSHHTPVDILILHTT